MGYEIFSLELALHILPIHNNQSTLLRCTLFKIFYHTKVFFFNLILERLAVLYRGSFVLKDPLDSLQLIGELVIIYLSIKFGEINSHPKIVPLRLQNPLMICDFKLIRTKFFMTRHLSWRVILLFFLMSWIDGEWGVANSSLILLKRHLDGDLLCVDLIGGL